MWNFNDFQKQNFKNTKFYYSSDASESHRNDLKTFLSGINTHIIFVIITVMRTKMIWVLLQLSVIIIISDLSFCLPSFCLTHANFFSDFCKIEFPWSDWNIPRPVHLLYVGSQLNGNQTVAPNLFMARFYHPIRQNYFAIYRFFVRKIFSRLDFTYFLCENP